MKEELKPCPFCGGEAKIDSWNSTDGYMNDWWKRVQCTVCDIAKLGKTEEEVIEAWNTRKLPENAPLTIDEVKELKEGDVVWMRYKSETIPIQIDRIDDNDFLYNCFRNMMTYGQYICNINKTYSLYRHKPEEEQK